MATMAVAAADMEKAKLLYVKLRMGVEKKVNAPKAPKKGDAPKKKKAVTKTSDGSKDTTDPDVPNVDTFKHALSEGGLAKAWAGVPGLRHKYFIYDSEAEVFSGVYVFYTEAALNDYLASERFANGGCGYPVTYGHLRGIKDVMPGTELAIEKTSWPSTPPTRDDVSAAKMLIVDLTLDYATGVEGLPTCKEELYGFMAAPPNGMGYPAQFGELEGLRGKYFAYDASIDHCYGFYTFVDQASLDTYMASDLFKLQGDPPHVKELSFKVHDVLPGTEACVDLGEWGSSAEK